MPSAPTLIGPEGSTAVAVALAGMQDERLLFFDLDQLCQVGLVLAHVDERVATVSEDAKSAVEVEVHARWLDGIRAERLDHDAARFECGPDVAVGQDHAMLTP